MFLKILKNIMCRRFLVEMSLNVLLFFCFELFFVIGFVFGSQMQIKEIVFASYFSLFSVLYLLLQEKFNPVSNYRLEKINHFLFSINTMFILALSFHFIDLYIFDYFFEVKNMYVINILFLSTIAFMFFFRYRNINSYLKHSQADYLLENEVYKLLNIDKKSLPKNTIIFENMNLDSVVAHEIGHLMIVLPFLQKDKDLLVSVVPDLDTKGYVITTLLQEIKTKRDYELKMAFSLGGLAAQYYEESINGTTLEKGSISDLSKFGYIASEYLHNGFSKKTFFVNASEKLDYKTAHIHNKEAVDYIYQSMLRKTLLYITINKEVYEDLKILLKEKKVLYVKDLLPFSKKIKGEIKCDL